jgi:hypothetical protein
MNTPSTLDSSLRHAGKHLLKADLDNSATPAQVQEQIESGRPLCVRVEWNGGDAHFLAIIGFDPKTQKLDIADPANGPTSGISFADFPKHYLGGGKWNDTYYTKPKA